MTDLHDAVEDYLAVRRRLGFTLERAGQLLPNFVEYLDTIGTDRLTIAAALDWAMIPQHAQPAWWATRLGIVRGFARYLRAVDPGHEVPSVGLLPARQSRTTPYLYSEGDVAGLMEQARHLAPAYRASIYETLVGLLAVSGMRLGEALGLDRSDVDFDHGVLNVRCAKFNKDRDVLLHPSTVDALARYADARDRNWPTVTTDAFFVSVRGLRLGAGTVHDVFRGLVRRAGLEGRGARGRPRPHDFRHSFAVSTLTAWYRSGEDVEARLPLLSTHLGHKDPGSTYWYLEAAPELLELAAQRLATVLGVGQ